MNLMTKFGQTYEFSANDHIRTLSQFVDCLDAVVVNNAPLQKKALEVYAKYQETPVVDDLGKSDLTVIRAAVASRQTVKKSNSDALVRSLIRHDSTLLAETLVAYLEKGSA